MFDINESGMDRVVRLTAGLALLSLGWSGAVAGGLGLAFKIIGFGPFLTGLFGWCPLYRLVHFRTESAMHGTRTT